MQYMLSVVLPYYYIQTYDFVSPTHGCDESTVEWVLWCLWSSCMSWHSSDGIVTTVWSGETVTVKLSVWSKRFFPLFPSVYPGCGTHLISYWRTTGVVTVEGKWPDRKVASSRIIMSGAIFPTYAFMMCIWAHFYLCLCNFPAPVSFVLHGHWFCYASLVVVSEKKSRTLRVLKKEL
jgi:hypothetical protein